MDNNYPKELLWNGREPDQVFEPTEELYYRVEPHVDKATLASQIRCPNTSVNRGKYSKPVHVLYAQYPKFIEWKVYELRVEEIPPKLENGNKKIIEFRIVHDPLKASPGCDENYAHSEIHASSGGLRKKNLPSTVDKAFREMLSFSMREIPRSVLFPEHPAQGEKTAEA